MKVRAVVAEFNPFHCGHKYLIDKMRDGGSVIAVMSGNFVQRGECAIYSKAERAESAVRGGVDLVLELPLVYSLGAAERFARGSVMLLNSCNIVDELWFGSESGNMDELTRAAEALSDESDAFKIKLAEKLNEGKSFPTARYAALGEAGKALNSPNNILGAEYLRVLKKLKSDITPVTVARFYADYNDLSEKSIDYSATAARKALRHANADAESSAVFMEYFDAMLAAKLKTAQKSDLLAIADCNNEIASRLLKAAKYNTFQDIAENTFCRRYTQGRIRRVMCNLLVSNTFRDFPVPSYIRPLAFNARGAQLLRKIKSSSSLPVAARGAALKNDEIFKLECRGTDIYSLACGKHGGGEFTFFPSVSCFEPQS